MSPLENAIVFFGVVIMSLLVIGATLKDAFHTHYPCVDGGRGICTKHYVPNSYDWKVCRGDVQYRCENGEDEEDEDPDTDDIPGC